MSGVEEFGFCKAGVGGASYGGGGASIKQTVPFIIGQHTPVRVGRVAAVTDSQLAPVHKIASIFTDGIMNTVICGGSTPAEEVDHSGG